jgi:hypothetical protein
MATGLLSTCLWVVGYDHLKPQRVEHELELASNWLSDVTPLSAAPKYSTLSRRQSIHSLVYQSIIEQPRNVERSLMRLDNETGSRRS